MGTTRVRTLAPDHTPDMIAAPGADPLMAPDSGQAPATAPLTAVAPRDRWRTASRQTAAAAAPMMTFAISLGLAVAPMGAAIAALWAAGTVLITLTRIVSLVQAGQALTSPDFPPLLANLDTAARAGFLAVGYLALIFALMALMAGLLGRGWGRLFILPGVAFTATALALLGIGVIFAAPLASDLPLPPASLIPLALYALMDAILVSGVMVDVRPTRSPSATGKRRAVRRPPHDVGSMPD